MWNLRIFSLKDLRPSTRVLIRKNKVTASSKTNHPPEATSLRFETRKVPLMA